MDIPPVDVEAQHALSVPASPYDSDAYNTADARVHFGPLRSPEKKFVPAIARSNSLHTQAPNSLLRRSPRLSSPRPVSSLRAAMLATDGGSMSADLQNDASGDSGLSRLGTPDNERTLPDEPSSVLASRIIRAQDNPSPPPNNPKSLVTDITSASASPTPPPGSEYGLKNGSLTPALHDFASINAVATPDLISFDSFSIPKEAFRYIITEPGHTAQSGDIPSIDDLFTHSPSPTPLQTDATPSIPLIAIAPPEREEGGTSEGRFEMTPESMDEQTVIRSLFFDTEESLGNSPQPEMQYPSKAAHLQEPNLAKTQAGVPIESAQPSDTYDSALLGEGEALVLTDSTDDTRTRREMKAGKRREVSFEVDVTTDLKGVSLQDEDKDRGLPVTSVPRQGSTRKRDRDILKTPTQVDYRELGSLSPVSTNLLTQLVPPLIHPPTPILETRAHDNVDEQNPEPLPLITPFTQPLPMLGTPLRSINPVRFSSPVRGNVLQSPNKPRLQPAALDDPGRTPARRITIDEAVTQGHVSPQKAARLTTEIGRAPVFNIPSTDSPARRVNIAEAPTPSSQKKWQGMRFGSPTRTAPRHRSTPTEPQTLASSGTKNTDGAGPSQRLLPSKESFSRSQVIGSSKITSNAHKPAKLPFPIVASKPHLPGSISEEPGTELQSNVPVKPTATSSPHKSGLKQTTSKIPRNVKPYARPPHSRPTDKELNKPTLMRTAELPKAVNSTRIISKSTEARVDIAGGNISYGKLESTPATPSKPTVSSTLKRKRVPEKVSPSHKPRPVVLLRQVPKVDGPLPESNGVIHVKRAVSHIRRVVDKQPETPLVQPLPTLPTKDVHHKEIPSKNIPEDVAPDLTPPSSPRIANSSSSPTLAPTEPTEPSSSSIRRRTTRSRKPVNPVSSVDPSGGSEPQPAPPRRKANAQSIRSDGVFSGMTAVALKALTSLNTIRNQKYLAAKLETKVIRKEGARPESPAVKIRTISQRMQDEKAKQRKERAARRARRGDEGSSGMDQAETDEPSDSEESSDWGDQNSSPSAKRHRRGPGEEEDYETPIRPERQAKRPRIGEDVLREERRVKWDRGLFTMIYVDEVKVGTRPPPKGDFLTKGCLASAAKAASLDNLGNLPEADSPLSGLVEESVEVKKFVYDNDVEPLSPVIVVKNTRLRSKKAKS